jgi:CheY-like chemotaxis protein
MHVLIIEDEPLIAMSVEVALRDCGCASFDFATSAAEAIAAASARCPDLITADVRLAPGCGIEAVGAICGSKEIPVIFITATATEIQLRRPGSIVVHKPFDHAAIKDAFSLAMGHVGARLQASSRKAEYLCGS